MSLITRDYKQNIDNSKDDDQCAIFESGKMPGINQFASPNFPHKYLPNSDCVRVIIKICKK